MIHTQYTEALGGVSVEQMQVLLHFHEECSVSHEAYKLFAQVDYSNLGSVAFLSLEEKEDWHYRRVYIYIQACMESN